MPSSVSVVIFQSLAVHRQPVLSARSVQCEPSLCTETGVKFLSLKLWEGACQTALSVSQLPLVQVVLDWRHGEFT